MSLAFSTPVPLELTLSGGVRFPDLEKAAGPVEVMLEPGARKRVLACRAFLDRCLADGRPVYGATTGFGPMVDFPGRADDRAQCDNLLDHLTSGQGDDLEPAVVRAMLLVRLSSLCQGRSGVSPGVIEALCAVLGTDFAPAVPEYGSVGASGDLVPLAHAVRALQGHGHAYIGGERLPAAAALEKVGLAPLELRGRDALALVNGTSLTAAAAGLACAQLLRAHATAVTLTACLVDLLGCAPAFLDPSLIAAFGHAEAARVADELRDRLSGGAVREGRGLQEPYSIRCTPQLLGAAGSSLGHAARVIGDDLASLSDNPLFFAEKDLVVHGGNFFGQPVAFAADLLTTTAIQLANLAERQLDLLLDPHRSGGLPPMLATEPGRQHGLQGVQIAATATVVAMRRAALPVSVQSLPTNGHNQDITPHGTQAAMNALSQAGRLRWLHGSLAVALRQAAHLSPRPPSARGCAPVWERLALTVAPVVVDRALDGDVRAAADLLDDLARGAGQVA